MRVPEQENRKIALGALAGNFLDHYNTVLYSFLSPFFAEWFFPELPLPLSLALTFLVIPLAMGIKPLGSLFFGAIGDRFGRKTAISYSLIGLGFSSLCFAFIPLYINGLASGIMILTLLRMAQNFFASGGSVGGAIYLLENVAKEKGPFYSALYSSMTIWGMMAASLGMGLIGDVKAHWPILYWIGGVAAFVGIAFQVRFPKEKKREWIPMKEVVKTYPREILAAAAAGGFSYMTFSYAFVLMVGLAPLLTDVTKEEMIWCNTWLLGIDGLLLPLFGFLAVRVGEGRLMRGATLAAMALALPIFICMRGESLGGIIASRCLVLIIGVAFCAPLHAWMQSLVPKEVRYRVLGVGYSLGTQLFGAPAAGVAMWSYYETGSLCMVAAWWMTMAAIAFAVLQFREAKVTIRSPVLSRL